MILILLLMGGLAFVQYKWTERIVESKDREIQRLTNRISELESKLTK